MAPSIVGLGAAVLACASTVAATKFSLVETYDKTNFLDKFHFFESRWTGPDTYNTVDPAGGHAWYVKANEAVNEGLVAVKGDDFYVGPDFKNKFENARRSVRLESNALYKRGLIIARFTHLPENKCGVWPAFWTAGDNWPNHGEVDLYEHWNNEKFNQPTLHTGNSSLPLESPRGQCKLTNNPSENAPIFSEDCDDTANNGWNQFAGQGCSVTDTKGPWAKPEGGTFALEWTDDYMKIFTFHNNDVPKDLGTANPDTSSWPSPAVHLKNNDCNLNSHFQEQRIILNVDFCGRPGGFPEVWGKSCKAETGVDKCTSFVSNHPEAFANAYFQVKDIRIFKDSREVPTSTSSVVSSTSSTSSTSSSSVPASTSSTPASSSEVSSSAVPSSTSAVPSTSSTPASSSEASSSVVPSSSAVVPSSSAEVSSTVPSSSSSAAPSSVSDVSSTVPSSVPVSSSEPSSAVPSSTSAAPSSISDVSSAAPSSVPASSTPGPSSAAPSSVIDTTSAPASWSSSSSKWANSSVPTTSAVEMTTSTVYTTKVQTITSCAPVVTDCPLGKVTTITVPLYTTVCPVSGKPTTTQTPVQPTGDNGSKTITSLVTKVYTITSCAPSITSCPVGKVTTEVSLTTFCPGDQKPTGSVPVQTNTVVIPVKPTGSNNNGTYTTVPRPSATLPGCQGPNCPGTQQPGGGCTGPNCPPTIISGTGRIAISALAAVVGIVAFAL